MIWGADRAKFGAPEETYKNRRICVTGLIQSYKGRPEVIVRSPTQIEGGS